MRISQPTGSDLLPYSNIRIQGCSDIKVGFTFLSEQPQVGKRRYCNKILVHECVSIPESDPIDLNRVEFISTDDPCYLDFNIYKSSEVVDAEAASIQIQTNLNGEAIGVLVTFFRNELCCLPLRMAYRLYGFVGDYDDRILLAQGSLYVSPCNCEDDYDIPTLIDGKWFGIDW